jgi:hypothetical protein
MPTSVAGIYKDGKVELLEKPSGLPEGPVQVILVERTDARPAPRFLERGKYRSSGRPMSTDEDFKVAEWRGEEDFDG